MIIVVVSRTPFGIVPRVCGACASPYERGKNQPCGYDRAHNKAPVNEFQFVHLPFHLNFSPGVIPPRQRRQYCQHERPAHCVRFILLSFRPSFLCSAPHRYNHSIASCQKNASGIRARAYNVIYIKRRFSCVVFTKTACAIGYFVV